MGFNAAILRRRRRLGGGSSLSISAPSAVLFADGDQPYSLDGVNAISFADGRFPNPKVISADIYVDSVNGSDGNDGSSVAQAFATISAAETAALSFGDNVRVALAYGSTWREMLDLSTLTGATVHGYGDISKPLPCLNASDIADPGDFSLAPSQSNTYLISWAHDIPNNYGKYKIRVWENGAMLKWVSSIANCEAEAGTFYVATGGIANPADVYVHPLGSTNPTSDGKTYEITAREYGLLIGDDYDVRYVHTTKQSCHNGSFQGGSNGYGEGILSTHGVVHNQWVADGGSIHKKCVAYKCEPSSWRNLNATLFVTYSDAGGSGATYEQCYSYSDAPSGEAHDNFYSHTQGGANVHDLLTYKNCFAYGPGGNFTAADLENLSIQNGFIQSTNTAADVLHIGASGADSVTVNNLTALSVSRLFQTADNLTATDVRAYIENPVTGGLMWTAGVDVQNSTFVFDSSLTDIQGFMFNAGTAVTFRNNVLQNAGYRAIRGLTGIDSDYNVIRSPNAASQLYYEYNGTAYSWADWLTQTGGDTNSVLQASNGTALVTDAANNDFTFTSTIVDEGGRAAGSRKHIATPNWAALTALWDAGYLGIDDAYTLTMTIEASGTIDFDNTTYAAVTENSGADASGAIDVTGTLAQINALFADPEPVLDNWSSETLEMSMTITHVATSRTASKTISVESTGEFTADAGWFTADTTDYTADAA